ncbi:MAG: tetratricopeptide repeat protein [Saprospiraceae bacterium]
MKNILFILLTLLCYLSGAAQKIHSPQEIVSILENSSIAYELNMLEEEIPAPDRSGNVILHDFYREMRNGELFTISYKISSKGVPLLEAAEKAFGQGDFVQARSFYEQVLQTDPDFHKVRTYIGQTYGIEGDFKKAIKWYQGAIEKNYIDYMAHWFLADAYLKNRKIDNAVDHITIAYILNRNNPRIRTSLDNIYKEKGLSQDDWHFNPQMKIDSTSEQSVAIQFHPDWLGYALVKALWRYEPGYAASQGQVKDEFFSMFQEREALAALITSIDEEKIKYYPELDALMTALKMDMTEEYIIFEILLPQYPDVANQLPEEVISRVLTYVLKVRGKAK